MIIKVKVKANASKTKILKENDYLKIAVAAAAKQGKANKELIKFLKKKYGGDVKIIRGKTSRKKIIEIIS
ncbi:YggU family protein [Candidatus Woesearchaeota archaeon]|nr:YggU family protein [Candidatus Woesearchaeota archaeon]